MKKHVMDIILILMGIFLFLFIVTMIVIFCLYQSVPDTLITAVAGLCGSECGIMGVIKTAKVINEKSEETDIRTEDNPSELGPESGELDEGEESE